MFAIREAHKAGLLTPQYWLNNIVAGVIVGVVALPLAMAFAIASGVKPEQGIYTAIIAGVIVSLFGGSRVQIAGPTGAFIVLLAGIVAQHGVIGLQIATLMAGAILLMLGLARLGSIIRYIPDPVIIGFTSGIGVIIWVGQWPDFFGLPAVQGEHFHQKLFNMFQVFPHFHFTTTLLALLSLFLVLFVPKIPRCQKIPGPLVALVLVTLVQYFFQFDGVRTIGSAFGGIPQGLPSFSIPSIQFSQVLSLIGPAFAIAMLGAIESLLSAVVADGMAGTKHNSNQELVGQGLANLVTPLFGGIAATGAIARTATNIRNGGNSPLAGVVHSITLVVILLVLAPLAVHIPLACLSAILFVVAWNMSEASRFVKLVKRAPKADIGILIITFLLTVFADLVIAVNIGVVIAILHFVKRMASSVEVKANTAQDIQEDLRACQLNQLPQDVVVYSLDGPFFFAAAEVFEQALMSIQEAPKVLIIRLKWVPFMDITGLQALEEMILRFQNKQTKVLISGANNRVAYKLKRAGIFQMIGEQAIFARFQDALCSAITEKESSSL